MNTYTKQYKIQLPLAYNQEGRPDRPLKPGKLYIQHIRVNQNGCDHRGAYWGPGPKLYCAEDSLGNQAFFRAANYGAALIHFERKQREDN